MDILSLAINPSPLPPPPQSLHSSPAPSPKKQLSTDVLNDWLVNDSFFSLDSNAIHEQTLHKASRTEVGLIVMNGVRKVLNSFKPRSKKASTTATATQALAPAPEAAPAPSESKAFDDQFPALSTNKPKPAPAAKKKQKKRIRPQLQTTSSSSSSASSNFTSVIQSPAFGLQATEEPTSTKGMMDAFDESALNIGDRVSSLSFSGIGGGKNLFNSDFSKVSVSAPPPLLPLSPKEVESRNKGDSVGLVETKLQEHPPPKITHVKKLAKIYATLLLHKSAPSTATELILLLKLLTMPDNFYPKPNEHKDDDDIIHTTLNSPKACNLFAATVLSAISPLLTFLFNDTLKTIITNCSKSLNQQTPALLKELAQKITTNNSSILISKNINEDIKSTTFYSRAFNSETDSRNDFKSQTHAKLYANREEARDVFLNQLRNFQDLKSMIDDSNLHQYNDNLKRNIMSLLVNLNSGNVVWFVEFFCDMLLQIGAVSSFKETDEEVLSNSKDKDRIQKLHRRFSTKTQTTTTTNNTYTYDDSTAAKNKQQQTPQHFFPDNQLFFYLFVKMCDSYTFITQLSRRLCGQIHKLSKEKLHTGGIINRILKLKLLARFLGLIVFSPNWSDNAINSSSVIGSNNNNNNNNALLVTAKNSINNINATNPILPIYDLIIESYSNNHLTLTIPWVVEYLRMSKVSERTNAMN